MLVQIQPPERSTAGPVPGFCREGRRPGAARRPRYSVAVRLGDAAPMEELIATVALFIVALAAEGWPLLVLCAGPIALCLLAVVAIVFVGPLALVGVVNLDD